MNLPQRIERSHRLYWAERTARQNARSRPAATGRVELGLAILGTLPSRPRTQAEIAAYCGCTQANIYLIEQSAMRKLRRRLFAARDPLLCELMEAVIGRAQFIRR